MSPYHVYMSSRPPDNSDQDIFDTVPVLNKVSTNLQRSLGPSCFLSLIISALIIILIRRYLKLPFIGMVGVTVFVWWAVLVVLVRLGGPVDDD